MKVNEHLKKKILQRLVVMPSGCWQLQTGGSYGVYFVAGKRLNLRRLAYTWLPDREPLGTYVVQSTCSNRRCLNPEHLVRGDRPKGGGQGSTVGIPQRRYPWSKLFTRAKFVMGSRDYAGTARTFAQQVRNNAPLHGVSVSIRIHGDKVIVYVTQRHSSRATLVSR